MCKNSTRFLSYLDLQWGNLSTKYFEWKSVISNGNEITGSTEVIIIHNI